MHKTLSLGLVISTLVVTMAASMYLSPDPKQDTPISPIPNPLTHSTIIDPTKKIYNPTNITITAQEYDVRGESMQPMIQDGDKVMVDLNYYNGGQHTVVSGDVVVFENPFTLDRIIKRVGIIPGDTIKKDLKNRTLIVNGKTLKNSLGESYIFDDLAYRWVDIYTKSGIIMDNTYFLYGDNINGSLDSRKTGPVGLEGIIGKEIMITHQ